MNSRDRDVTPTSRIAFLVASDDAITIVTAETNLGNIFETWGIPFREVNAFSLHNQ